MQKYEAEIYYHPGKHMYLADVLSCAYLPHEETESINMLQNQE